MSDFTWTERVGSVFRGAEVRNTESEVGGRRSDRTESEGDPFRVGGSSGSMLGRGTPSVEDERG